MFYRNRGSSNNDEEGQERRSKKKEKMDEILETSLIIANGSNCAKGSNGKKVENINLRIGHFKNT